ncbi:uncharacterized protein LOC134263221 [Saccostrea cucullata]|uniref:uncharacterized protein LOC134263221 n=1 Tax=Saccostrea cuccullata TaxID=36930 RepID=UPI002ED55B47
MVTFTLQDLNRIYGPFVVTKDVIGNRYLLSMTCYTTIGTFHAETSQHIRWCIRTGKDKHFQVLPLQEKPNEEIFKTSFGIKFKSSVLYQLSKSLRNVEIICETNFSSDCGFGSVQERVFLNNDTHDCNWTISSNRSSTQFYLGIGGMVIGGTLIFLAVLIFVKTWNNGGNKEMYKEDNSASNEGPRCVNSIKPSSKESEIPIQNVHQQQSQEQLLEEMMLPTGESSAVLNTDRVQCESMYSHINADIYDLVSYSKTEDHIYQKQEVVLKQVETNE